MTITVICLLSGFTGGLLLGGRDRRRRDRAQQARVLRLAVARIEAEAALKGHRGPMAA